MTPEERMQEDFLSGSWCEECESLTNHTTEQHGGLHRAIARELGGWCPEIGPLSRRPLEAATGDTYLVVEGNQHKLFVWADNQWHEVK